MNHVPQSINQGFSGLGIAPRLMEVLTRLNFKNPTPIQRQAIPIALQGKDLVGVAQTGTGKTLAFGIPMIQRLNQINGCGLVILPTRELALQVDEELNRLGRKFDLRTVVLIGGAAIGPQIQALRRDPRIIIATPGRLNDHIQQKTVNLKNVQIVVLDEADRMLDMGFAPQIKRVFMALPSVRQTMLFSATLAPEIMQMATTFLKLPISIEVAPTGSIAENLTQEIFIINKEDKIRLVDKLLEKYLGSVLIFSRTKHGAKKITKCIRDMGHRVAEIHSNRSLSQRQDAIAGFKSGKYRVLVATDIASRGIDVVGIEVVINFDLSTKTEDYVHRIGRTARAGGAGHAISFVGPDQRREVQNIERLIRKNLPISPVPELPPRRKSQFDDQIEFRPRKFRGTHETRSQNKSSRSSRFFSNSKKTFRPRGVFGNRGRRGN